MASAEVSGIAQSLASVANSRSGSLSSKEEKAAASPVAPAVEVLSKEGSPNSVDTVNISEMSRQAIADVKQEEAKKEEKNVASDVVKPGSATSKIEFVYDLKGELSVRFMDTASRVIYQVPSELMMKLKEAFSKSDSSVNTKA